jgi:amino-acid N-acetyltransferase
VSAAANSQRPDIHLRPDREGAVRLLESAGLPSTDLTDAMLEHFFFVGSMGAPIALVGLELLGNVALLRSLAVTPASRSQGLGLALLAHAERYAKARGVSQLYLLTTTAAGFFERHGFAPVAREEVPAAIRSTREFSEICPASSSNMVKHL